MDNENYEIILIIISNPTCYIPIVNNNILYLGTLSIKKKKKLYWNQIKWFYLLNNDD